MKFQHALIYANCAPCSLTDVNVVMNPQQTVFTCVVFYIEKFQVQVPKPQWKSKQKVVSKKTKSFYSKFETIDDRTQYDEDDANYMEMNEHNDNMHQQAQTVTVRILSPIVNIIWLWLCVAWRNLLDFDFKRSLDWNDDTPVTRFNDTLYVSMHNIFDWHSFAMLANGTMIYRALILERRNKQRWFVIKVEYRMPDALAAATHRNDFKNSNNLQWWKPDIIVHYKIIRTSAEINTVSNDTYEYKLKPTSKLKVIQPQQLHGPLFDASGNHINIEPAVQHPHVKLNSEYLFFILGFDKYHHTPFEGPNDYNTHGLYWWIGNMNAHFQFKKQLTMIMGQVPHCVKLNTIGRICYTEWQHIMQHGILLWTGTAFKKVFGMVSHQITDMQDRDHFMRRRGNSTKSRSDGMLWQGWGSGCKWPKRVHSLLQMGTIAPGPYLLKVWKHLTETCVQRGCWSKLPNTIGKQITMTTSNDDIYNELPLASSLKSTIEINHTTLLGCTSKSFALEWYGAHSTGNLEENHTRMLMKCMLQQSFHMINGCKSMLILHKTKMCNFNQMQRAWQKLIEILICLPSITNWFGNLSSVISLIRITGAMYNCKSKKERCRIEKLIKPILKNSYVNPIYTYTTYVAVMNS